MEKKHILIVINDLLDEEVLHLERAINPDNGHRFDGKLSLVYVIPRLPIYYFAAPQTSTLLDLYYNEAKLLLDQVGSRLNIEKNDQWLLEGSLRTESLRLANKVQAESILASTMQMDHFKRSLFFKAIDQYRPIAAPKKEFAITEAHVC